MNATTQAEKPAETEAKPEPKTERELLAAILAELRKLNERAEKTGVMVHDKFR
jgi:hypothetical protein